MTSTLAGGLDGPDRLDGFPSCLPACPACPALLENLRSERDDLHEPSHAQLARDRTEHAGTDRLVVVVDQHGGVAIEADVTAVAAALLLDRANDHRLDDLPLLDGALGRRLFHRRGDDVAQPRVAAGRSTDRVDD